jgi:predicted PurR-regulated permease PerM
MRTTTSSVIKKLLVVFLVVSGLYIAKPFLMPLAIGGVLATLFLPLCRWLQERKIPKAIAVTLCVLSFLFLITGVVALLSWQISGITNDFLLLKQRALQTGERLQEYIFNHIGVSASKQTEILINEQPSVTNMVHAMAGSVSYLFTNFILVVVYIFLLLYYRTHLRRFFLKLIPPADQPEMGEVLGKITHVSQEYLVGLSKMIGLLWVMYGIGFSLLGVKNALFFAVLCGLLEIVPFIGNITGTSLTVIVSAVDGASTPKLLGIIGTYIMIQLIQGWILEPIILGPQVKINPFTTILVLVLGELLWGIPGIFLAIPLVAMFKIVCDHVDSLKPYGFLIGEIESGKEVIRFLKKKSAVGKTHRA